MRKCPHCKFLLTEHAATCRFCGQLLDGAHANDAQVLPFEPGVDLTRHDPDSLHAQPVVRRAGEGRLPDDDRRPERFGVLRSTRPGSSAPVEFDSYNAAGERAHDHGEHHGLLARHRWIIAGLGLLLALIVGVVFYVRSSTEVNGVHAASMSSPSLQWERVGPPTVPFTAELPGMAKGVSLRPFEDIPTVALQAEIEQSAFVVGAFDLPQGALAFGADAYLRATAERLATVRLMAMGDGLGADRREGRVYDAPMANAAGGGGWVHLLIADQRVYFAVVYVPLDAASVRTVFDRMAQSLLPA